MSVNTRLPATCGFTHIAYRSVAMKMIYHPLTLLLCIESSCGTLESCLSSKAKRRTSSSKVWMWFKLLRIESYKTQWLEFCRTDSDLRVRQKHSHTIISRCFWMLLTDLAKHTEVPKLSMKVRCLTRKCCSEDVMLLRTPPCYHRAIRCHSTPSPFPCKKWSFLGRALKLGVCYSKEWIVFGMRKIHVSLLFPKVWSLLWIFTQISFRPPPGGGASSQHQHHYLFLVVFFSSLFSTTTTSS